MQISTLNIAVNGEKYQLQDGDTVSALLEQMNIPHTRVAVMINQSVIKTAAFHTARIAEGDRVEILTFAGGG